MRILAVSHDSTLYGAQRSFFDAVYGLKQKGHIVEACAPREGPLTQLLRDEGIEVHIIGFGLWIPPVVQANRRWALKYIATIPGNIVTICRLIKSRKIDAVYTNTITVLDFAVSSRLLGVPHVWHIREAAFGNPQLKGYMSNPMVGRIVSALSERLIFNSVYLKKKYAVGVEAKNVVVYNGIGAFERPTRPFVADTGVVRLITIGFMEKRKGLDILLDALCELPGEICKKVELSVVGDVESNYLTTEIKPRLERLGGRISVVFKGWMENVESSLLESDVLVSSARDEPFGRTVVEGMLAGLPVISTRSGGPEEIVEDRVTGRLVDVDKPIDLAAAISELASSPELRRSFGDAGARRAIGMFNLRQYVDGIEGALLSAID